MDSYKSKIADIMLLFSVLFVVFSTITLTLRIGIKNIKESTLRAFIKIKEIISRKEVKRVIAILLILVVIILALKIGQIIIYEKLKCNQDSDCNIQRECIANQCIKIKVNMTLKKDFNYSGCLGTNRNAFSYEHSGLILDFNQDMTPRKVQKFFNSTKINITSYEHSYSGSYLIVINSTTEVEDACLLESYEIVSNIWANQVMSFW